MPLLEAGANPNAQTEESRISALHILFNSRHLRSDQEELMLILGDLLDRGASLTIRDSNGAMPLHFAARNNYAQGIKKTCKESKTARNKTILIGKTTSTALLCSRLMFFNLDKLLLNF